MTHLFIDIKLIMLVAKLKGKTSIYKCEVQLHVKLELFISTLCNVYEELPSILFLFNKLYNTGSFWKIISCISHLRLYVFRKKHLRQQ